MRPIDADALEKFLKRLRRELPKESRDFFTRDEMILNFQQYIRMQPTIDAVPVVRCGECANAKCIDKNESVYTCTHPQWTRRSHNDTFEESQLFHGLDGNDFCSYGAKMDEG